jgi:hypothetical protein
MQIQVCDKNVLVELAGGKCVNVFLSSVTKSVPKDIIYFYLESLDIARFLV